MPIDPSFAVSGAEWQIGSVADTAAPVQDSTGGDQGFAGALGEQIQKLSDLQTEAAEQSRALAEGTAQDPAEVVMAVERARLSMQLASQIRTKAVEAAQDIFHTTV
jgi:flagellar hook-basal body complex protein FliE